MLKTGVAMGAAYPAPVSEATDCCCLSFDEKLFLNPRYTRPLAPPPPPVRLPTSLPTSLPTAPPIVQHFASHAPAFSSGAAVAAQRPTEVHQGTGLSGVDSAAPSEPAKESPVLEVEPVGAAAAVAAAQAETSEPKLPAARSQDDPLPPAPDAAGASTELESKQRGEGEALVPSGSEGPKYVLWEGVLYAQPAIGESEMRARADSIDFTETERQLVYEMIDATRYMFEASSVEARFFNEESLNDFVYFCDDALRRLIKTVKQIRAFRILGMDDQIMLLKAACFKILLLRSCLHYHDDIEGWRDRQGRIIPLKSLKKAKSHVYERHKEIMTKLCGPLRTDRIIMGFMALVLLFDSKDTLKHNSSVGLDNLIYLCILRKYLIGTQPEPLEKYERLVESMHMINVCNEEYNVFFSRNFQPEQITPLLIEIFDISINNSV